MEKEEKRIERIIHETIENTWEEAKLRDFMNLYIMWEKGDLPQFKTFGEFLDKFFNYDDQVRELNEKEYCKLEGAVVDCICNSPKGIHSSLCRKKDD